MYPGEADFLKPMDVKMASSEYPLYESIGEVGTGNTVPATPGRKKSKRNALLYFLVENEEFEIIRMWFRKPCDGSNIQNTRSEKYP